MFIKPYNDCPDPNKKSGEEKFIEKYVGTNGTSDFYEHYYLANYKVCGIQIYRNDLLI